MKRLGLAAGAFFVAAAALWIGTQQPQRMVVTSLQQRFACLGGHTAIHPADVAGRIQTVASTDGHDAVAPDGKMSRSAR